MYGEITGRRERGEDLVVVTVVEKKGSAPSKVGSKMIVSASGPPCGTVGGGSLEQEAVNTAGQLLKTRTHLLRAYVFGNAETPASRTETVLPMLCGGGATLFYDFVGAEGSALLFGAGHVGRAIAYHLAPLGFQITLADTRKEVLDTVRNGGVTKVLLSSYQSISEVAAVPSGCFCVVATHSHEEDYRVLKNLVQAEFEPVYIGVIASRTKAKTFIERLSVEGFKKLPEGILHMPAGLDIGGPSPDEIALSVLSEIQALRYGKSGHRHMRDRIPTPR